MVQFQSIAIIKKGLFLSKAMIIMQIKDNNYIPKRPLFIPELFTFTHCLPICR